MLKKEVILVERDSEGRIIYIINRIDGEQKYEIYTTAVAGVEDVIDMFNETKKIVEIKDKKDNEIFRYL